MTRTTRILLATGTALLMTLPIGATFAQAAPAATPTSNTRTTTATTVTVSAGDTLSGLATRHGVGLSALLRANSMTLTSLIRPGDQLIIPAGARTPAGSPTIAPTASAATTGATANGATTYVVKAGDALASIARRHGVKLGALVTANNLKVTSVIVPGQALKVPAATMPIPAPRAVTAAAPAAVPATVAATAPANAQGVVQGVVQGVAAPGAGAPASSIDTVLAFLRAQVGVPYAFFRAGPDAFDCSGLVVAAFRQVGVSLPHQSRALAQRGSAVDWTTTPIMAGDLVFTSVVGDPTMITHVGVALDATTWIHAVGVGRTVSIGTIPASAKIMAVRRIPLP